MSKTESFWNKKKIIFYFYLYIFISFLFYFESSFHSGDFNLSDFQMSWHDQMSMHETQNNNENNESLVMKFGWFM